ncbi:MAG: AAA family ATPase, partial [Ignavibacteriae bacterium]|nr:AAA family ATPase [Ignavibacteriota bacterium]
MTEKIVKLKKLWQEKEGNLNTENAESEYKGFIEKFPLEKINDLKLDKYTNIKSQTAEEYFTHWIERKTESCGKFRTSSSFSYGVYKVNSENINDNEKRKSETDLYCTLEQKYIKAINEKYVAKEKAENYFDENVKPKLMKLIKFEEIENTNPLDINYARKIAYMYYPEKLLAIFNKTTIEAIADFFGIKEAIDLSSYKVTEKILDKVKEQFEINGDITFKITQKLTMFLWDYFGKSFPFDSKNVIFYGAPGTGKTYTVQNTIRQKVLLDDDDINDVALFTQFHPSFSYEDFIDGLKPAINNGATELKLTNGIFKKFCKKATQNLYKSRIDGKEPKLYYFVADEINRAELSTVFGELLSCLEESKRIDFDDEGNLLERSLLL